MPITIDAHHHLWQLGQPFDHLWLDAPDKAPIRRDVLPEHLEPLLRANGIDASIIVQTQHDIEENRWALIHADNHSFICGVVGWVDLASDKCEEQVDFFKYHPKFVGVRHLVQDEPDDDFLVRPEIVRGLKVLAKHEMPFDLLVYPRHLRHVPTLAREIPTLPMVIDHLGKPDIKGRGFEAWAGDFRAAATFPNVHCKLSGMATEADWSSWTAADLKPYVQTALEAFTPDRLMFGSDWPVCELAGSYERIKRALEEALGPLGDGERAAIFGETARKFYDPYLDG
ncbi:amidohydrolase family protein [Tundrisphaera sp. TA3]|uniref:amidohydrolase family protein n=1 Tax=Tundrisphaera sp. TA3 TaxID=3435775 RepID=UPI003EBD8797